MPFSSLEAMATRGDEQIDATNVGDICRVCLAPTASRKNSNLFFAAGRSVQLWAKVMACAWVQVFEGDGLPSQICYKCHNRLDIAYQFKQQCEAADAYIRQMLNRSSSNKVNTTQNDVILQNSSDYLADCKPINFNITTECLDLVQSDLSLPALRLTSQDIPSTQIDFRTTRDTDFSELKQEPGFLNSLNTIADIPLTKNIDCQVVSADFKCESFNESEIILNNLPAKLFESMNDATMNDNSTELTAHIDNKLALWDLNHKESALSKTDFLFNADDKENDIDKGKDMNIAPDHVDITFLTDERCVSPLNGKCMLPDVCSDSSTMEIDNECSYGNNDSDYPIIAPVPPAPDPPQVEVSINENVPDVPIIAKKKRKKKPSKNKSTTGSIEKSLRPKRKRKNVPEQCELCGKLFKHGRYMNQHLRTHTGDRPYTCSFCDLKFVSCATLVKHVRRHSGVRPYVCELCGKGFAQSAGLKSHMRAHTGEKPYKCEVCDKTFSQKSNLFIHKQSHSEKRSHVCSICNKAFKFYKHLQSHLTLHSAEKEFQCSVCQKCFHRKSYLQIHLSIHSGERPFKCTVCDHAFSNASNLKAHSRVHSGVKPYKCTVCLRAFSQSGALNRHMHQHSNPTKTVSLPPTRLIE